MLIKKASTTYPHSNLTSLSRSSTQVDVPRVFPDLSRNSPTNRPPSIQEDESLCTFLDDGFGPSIMISTEEVHAFKSIIGEPIEEFRVGVLPRVTFEETLAMMDKEEIFGIFEVEIDERGEGLHLVSSFVFHPCVHGRRRWCADGSIWGHLPSPDPDTRVVQQSLLAPLGL